MRCEGRLSSLTLGSGIVRLDSLPDGASRQRWRSSGGSCLPSSGPSDDEERTPAEAAWDVTLEAGQTIQRRPADRHIGTRHFFLPVASLRAGPGNGVGGEDISDD
jgi:hypothetical protein